MPYPIAPYFIGISYLAFRCSRLVLEVRNGTVKKPNFLEYLNFAFFLPTMPVGPINTYANYRRGFEARHMMFLWSRGHCVFSWAPSNMSSSAICATS